MHGIISIEELIPHIENKTMTLIDVRSPSEFREFTIPGSINIPFFTDEERAEIGTIYKKVSVEAAKERGLQIMSAKLPEYVKQFKEAEGDKTVFCWRGGMRSKTTAAVLALMDVHVQRLEGGIRAYRRWTVKQYENLQLPSKAIVLNGLTGSGKTKILQQLEKEGYPAIDLEGMANHRGSIFGFIGRTPHSQKEFDALLAHRLRHLKDVPYVVFEAESNRIGKAALPQSLKNLRDSATHLIIEMPMEERVHEIIKDYNPWDYHEQCIEAFSKIKRRIHTPIAKQIDIDLREGNFSSAVRLLLEHYYDERYKFTEEQYPESQKLTLKVKNVEEGIKAVKQAIGQLMAVEKKIG